MEGLVAGLVAPQAGLEPTTLGLTRLRVNSRMALEATLTSW